MKKKVLVIDNYDSFTYNLVHMLKALGCEVIVKRNDKLALEEVESFDKILLSPGPGIPDEAGLLKQIIRTYAPTKSMLGVCLGHQAIAEVFGGTIFNLDRVYHGVATSIQQTANQSALFETLPESFEVGRYHSWNVEESLPDCFETTAVDDQGRVMAIQHKTYAVAGVQFHPESILTEHGNQMLENWLKQ